MPEIEEQSRITHYKGYTIMVIVWADTERYYAEYDDGFNHAGAAPGLYDTIEQAVAACKDAIDHPYRNRP